MPHSFYSLHEDSRILTHKPYWFVHPEVAEICWDEVWSLWFNAVKRKVPGTYHTYVGNVDLLSTISLWMFNRNAQIGMIRLLIENLDRIQYLLGASWSTSLECWVYLSVCSLLLIDYLDGIHCLSGASWNISLNWWVYLSLCFWLIIWLDRIHCLLGALRYISFECRLNLSLCSLLLIDHFDRIHCLLEGYDSIVDRPSESHSMLVEGFMKHISWMLDVLELVFPIVDWLSSGGWHSLLVRGFVKHICWIMGVLELVFPSLIHYLDRIHCLLGASRYLSFECRLKLSMCSLFWLTH